MAPTSKSSLLPSPLIQGLHVRGINGAARRSKTPTQSMSAESSYELELPALGQPAEESGQPLQPPEPDLGPAFDSGAFHQIQERDSQCSPHVLRRSQSTMRLMGLGVPRRLAPGWELGDTGDERNPGGPFHDFFDFNVQAYLWVGKAEIDLCQNYDRDVLWTWLIKFRNVEYCWSAVNWVSSFLLYHFLPGCIYG